MEQIYFLIPNWKWLSLLGVAGGVILLHPIFTFFFKVIKNKFFQVEQDHFTHQFLKENIENDLSWLITFLLALVAVENLDLPANLLKYSLIILKLGIAFSLIRLTYHATHAAGSLMERWAAKTESTVDDQLVPLAKRALKIVVVIVGVLVLLQNFGVNVTALLAGLGIGGIAIAFAAQDTVANVFGTITIFLDAPFKIGDRVRVADTEGFIEEIGFRSTRLRTLYNSVVTLPNSTMAKEKVDNLTERMNVFRFRTVLGFTYSSTKEQLTQFCERLRYELTLDPAVDPKRVSITFNEFAESSLNILVNFHFKLQNSDEELNFQQNYLFLIYKLADELKLNFAFPTRTLLIENSAP